MTEYFFCIGTLKWFDRDKHAWGKIFFDLDLARKFAATYLNHVQDLKLLAIALTAEY
ncbi:MAG: hypothetical protein ACFCAD_09770 [Pleurocapsa sp.]